MKQTHIGAYGLIENNGKILLTEHISGPYKGLLDLPGGSFLHGETARQCVTREIEKDFDLDINELKLSDVVTDRVEWTNDTEQEDLHLICILFNIRATIKRLKDASLKWFNINEIDKSLLTPIATKALAEYTK